jgi:hypothetical protein
VEGGEKSLPCAVTKRTANKTFAVHFFLAHDKQDLCRAPYKNAQQTRPLPCARNKAHGKGFDARQRWVFDMILIFGTRDSKLVERRLM